jgi:hypothetical protein
MFLMNLESRGNVRITTTTTTTTTTEGASDSWQVGDVIMLSVQI